MAKAHKYTIGIDCESVEGRTWGVARIVNKLIEHMPKIASDDVNFVLYFKEHVPDNARRLVGDRVKIKVLKIPFLPRQSFILYYIFMLPFFSRQDKLDAIFLPNYMLPFLLNTKTCVFLTEDVFEEMKSRNQSFQNRIRLKLFAKRAAAKSDKILAISNQSAKNIQLIYGIGSDRVSVCLLGADIRNPEVDLESVAKDIDLLYVGQAFERRHLREALLAFEIVAKNTKLKMSVVSVDRYKPPIIEGMIREINTRLGYVAINYSSQVDQVGLEQKFARAKTLAYVSTHEAFGLPPVEALAYGIKPIVYDSPLSRELFDTHCYYIKDPKNIDEFASTISNAIISYKKVDRQSIMSRANLFKWENFAHRFKKMMINLCIS